MEKGRFLKVKCPRCRLQKIIFGKASTKVKCERCDYLMLKAGGGKAKICSQIIEVL